CDPEEMRLATTWCATESTGPVYMRLGKAGEPDLTANAADPFEVGKVRVLNSGDGSLCILSYGITVDMALKTAALYKERTGQEAAVVSCHTIKPLDENGIAEILRKYQKVAVIEEHVPHGGLGSRVKGIACDIAAPARVLGFSLKDEFIHFYGNHTELLDVHGLSPDKIVGSLI
ncbi:MAG: transketolase C-terminal domain-containing protein, partial [Nisaea sp.]